jgi:tetratricopeptide (TPR) repeat protein
VRNATRAALALALLWVASATGQPPKGPKVPPLVAQEQPAKPPAWPAGYSVRWPLRLIGDPTKQTAQTVLASVPTCGRLKPDASDIVVQAASGELLPCTVVSHDPAGDTIVQFQRKGNELWYWACGGNPNAAPQAKYEPKEGLTLELRAWAGDDIASWASVRDGLKKSQTVVGNALVAEVMQNGNPGNWEKPYQFAASYRGALDIKKDGTYRFFVNADDASFLFIDGFKVCERPGANQYIHRTKQKELLEKCGKIDLKAGAHSIEVHHVVGNNTKSMGVCALLWQPEGEALFTFMPRTAFAPPLYARATHAEAVNGSAPVVFSHGIDDVLLSGAVKVYLVRFEAHGDIKEPDKCVWDFGDGTTGTGRSVVHAYFSLGDRTVALTAPGVAPCKRRVDVWSSNVVCSPFSLAKAVRSISASDWKKPGHEYARQVLAFLEVCEQPNRWPLVDEVAAFLLTKDGLELEDRTRLAISRIEALAALGKPQDALKLAAEAEKAVAKVPSLLIAVRLAAAAVHQYQLKDAPAASKLYKEMLDEYKRVEHPNLRIAAVRWGDLHAEAGDIPKASEAYRLAATLGGEKFAKTAQVDAVTRGAQLRIAEQRLRAGDIRQCRQLLEQIELNFPEQKLEGHYRYLRAEADRHGGHYEEAIRGYEVIARLPQWAGYRSRAVHGIADANYRLGALDKSLEWYNALKTTFADYYEKEKLAEVVKLITARQERVKAAKAKGEKVAAFTEGYEAGLEPGEPDTQVNFPISRGFGMQGDHVGVLEAPLAMTVFTYIRPIPDVNTGGTYWVEFWYRDQANSINRVNQQALYGWIAGAGLPNPHVPAVGPIYTERTFGQWRKAGFKAKGPLAADGHLRIHVMNAMGYMEIDAISVRPVSDRENDSLTGFLEGTEAP